MVRQMLDNVIMLMLQSESMKLTSTTPVSKGLATKSVLVAVAVLTAVSMPMMLFSSAHADQYDDQMNALRGQMNQFQSQANELNARATTYEAALAQLTEQKNAIIAQIHISQQQYDQLQLQIEATQKKIDNNKEALGQIIADMYVSGTVSPLEMLASSSNIADYVDQQAYRSSIQDSLKATIKDINDLKKKLIKSQKDVQDIMKQQEGQKAQLAAKEAEQQDLVTRTRGDEAAYQQLVSNAQAQIDSAAAQQRAYYDSLRSQGANFDSGVVGSFEYTNWSGNMGCAGGYPYCGPQDSMVDPWQLYNRECVSYVAWAMQARFNKRVNGFQGQGNAYEWTRSGPMFSGAYRVDSPQPGDAVILPIISGFAPIGHAMVVESVNGGWVRVSQYNFYGTGEYSTMDIRTSGVAFLRFPNR